MSSAPLTITLGPTQADVAHQLAQRWHVPVEKAIIRALWEALQMSDPNIYVNRQELLAGIMALPTVSRP